MDGKSPNQVREATPAQDAEWEKFSPSVPPIEYRLALPNFGGECFKQRWNRE
jgi:hypothetical protein